MTLHSAARSVYFSFVTSVLVTIPLALVLTVYNLGFGAGFLSAYATNSVIAVVVSTFASLAATPLAQRFVRITAGSPQRRGPRAPSARS